MMTRERPFLDQDHRRPAAPVVVGGHGITVGTRGGHDQDVSRFGTGDDGVAHEDVAALAMLAGNGDDRVGRGIDLVGQQPLVMGLVQHGSDVVAHATVHAHVGAHSGDLLDGTHPIGRHTRLAHDGPPGLDEDPGHGQTQRAHLLAHALHFDGHVVGDGRGDVFVRVADTQTSPDVEAAAGETQLAMSLADQLHQDVDGLAKAIELEDLAADVSVEAHQVQMRRLLRLPDGLQSYSVGEAEAELRIDLPSLDVRMRVRFDARSDAQEDVLGPASLRRKLLQHGQFLEAVHHHVPHTDREGVLELLFGLVVAVKEDAFRREAGHLAMWNSPPDDTSMESPSSNTSWSRATEEKALLA